MDVTKFLHKLAIAPNTVSNIEIVIALLPEALGKSPLEPKPGLNWAPPPVPTQAKRRLEWGTSLKPGLKQGSYRSGEPLRHSKSLDFHLARKKSKRIPALSRPGIGDCSTGLDS
jgi:hypothetical protein